MEPLGAPALTIYSLFLTIKKTTYKFQKIPRARFSLGSQPYQKFLIYLRQIPLLPNHHQRRIHFGTV